MEYVGPNVYVEISDFGDIKLSCFGRVIYLGPDDFERLKEYVEKAALERDAVRDTAHIEAGDPT